MKIIPSDLDSAAQKGIITPEQSQNLWAYLESLRPEQAKFQALHVLYYFGGILIMASMSWFLLNSMENGIAIMAISLFFGLTYFFIGKSLWNRPHLKIPGGLLITVAVGLTPVFVYGLEKTIELGSTSLFIHERWMLMEVATVIAASIALRFFQFTFLTFPLAFALWCMSLHFGPQVLGKTDFTYNEAKVVSCIFGLIVLIVAYLVDRKNRKMDFAFWLYLYGLMAFWGGLTLMDSDNELGKFFYCLINLSLIVKSVYLRRSAFIVFGTAGLMGYLGHLAWQVFKDSYVFPVALSCLGLGIVFLGVKYQKNKERFEKAIERRLPAFLMRWRPEERA